MTQRPDPSNDPIPTRTIQGQLFQFADWNEDKASSQATARDLRRRGYLARIVKETLGRNTYYIVYARPKSVIPTPGEAENA